jgi:hypothetical protein
MPPDRSAVESGSSAVVFCALCGQARTDGASLCAGHHSDAEDGWAAVNRIMCDFVHRGIAARRLGPGERALSTHRVRAADPIGPAPERMGWRC